MNAIQCHNFLLANTFQCQQSLLTIINFMSCEDLQAMYQAIQSMNVKLSHTTQNIILSFIFTKKYLTKVDRTMSYFIYQTPLTQHIDSLSALNIALNSHEQVQNLSETFNRLFNDFQHKCMMSVQQVETMKMIVTEPDLPLPVSLRSNIGQHCSSNFQLFVCSKIAQPFYSLSDESEFSQFKNFLYSNEEKYIKSIMTNSPSSNTLINNIKQMYENPDLFMETLSETQEALPQDNHIYNFFITLMKLTKTLIKTIKLRLQSVNSDPYTYFTEFLLRYSLYKNYLLQLEDTLGPVVDSFKSILEDSLNLNFAKGNKQTQFSLWKILIRTFAKSMDSEIQKCLPIYMNLVHKTKLKWNNKLYLKHNSLSQQSVIAGMEEFEGSAVLEYLIEKDNIDNAQVFVSDFMEMLVDFSVDESNVLLCGSSRQQLTNKHFEKLEQLIVEHEIEIIKRMLEQSEYKQIEGQSQEQFQFLERQLNVKPRTLRVLVSQLDHESIRMDFERVDEALAQINKKYFGQVYDMKSSKQSSGSTLTTDSDENETGSDFEFEGLEYFSQVDEEQTQQIDL